MKKILAIILALTNLFGLIGCSADIVKNDEAKTSPYYGNVTGSRIYVEAGDYIVLYQFSSRDIKQIDNFEQMVVSSAYHCNEYLMCDTRSAIV